MRVAVIYVEQGKREDYSALCVCGYSSNKAMRLWMTMCNEKMY